MMSLAGSTDLISANPWPAKPGVMSCRLAAAAAAKTGPAHACQNDRMLDTENAANAVPIRHVVLHLCFRQAIPDLTNDRYLLVLFLSNFGKAGSITSNAAR